MMPERMPLENKNPVPGSALAAARGIRRNDFHNTVDETTQVTTEIAVSGVSREQSVDTSSGHGMELPEPISYGTPERVEETKPTPIQAPKSDLHVVKDGNQELDNRMRGAAQTAIRGVFGKHPQHQSKQITEPLKFEPPRQ